MKTIRIAVALLFALGVSSALAESMTGLERQHLVAHLEMTGSWLVDEVSGLSPAQLEFRPAPGSWSIMQVVEHLMIADPIYWQDFKNAMKAAPSNRKRSSSDDSVLWYGIDRTQRQKAIPAEDVKGKLHDLGAGLAVVRKVHAQMLEYIKTTDEDFRSHVVEREGSDAYQWLLLISTHEQRHILQIREIKADPKFPRR